jgi:hypothetical protein
MRKTIFFVWCLIIAVLVIAIHWLSEVTPPLYFFVGDYEIRTSMIGMSIACLGILYVTYWLVKTASFILQTPANLHHYVGKERINKLMELQVQLIGGLIVNDHKRNSRIAANIKPLLYDNPKMLEICSLLARPWYGASDGVRLLDVQHEKTKEVYSKFALQSVTEGGELIVVRDKVEKMWAHKAPPKLVVHEMVRAMIRSESWDEMDRYIMEHDDCFTSEQYHHLKALGRFNICRYLSAIGLVEDVFLLTQDIMLTTPEMIYAPLILIDIVARYGDRRGSMSALRDYALRSSFRGLGNYMLRLLDSQTPKQIYDFTIKTRVHDTTDQEMKFIYIVVCLMLDKVDEAMAMLERTLEEDDRSLRLCLLQILCECLGTKYEESIWGWVREALLKHREFIPELYFDLTDFLFTQDVAMDDPNFLYVRRP